MPLPFEPAGLPLLLGSLPHRSEAQALEVSRRYAGALLAWPQLPRRGFREHGLVQSVAGFPGLVLDSAQSRAYIRRSEAERGLNELALAYLEHDIGRAALPADDTAGLAELERQGDSLRGTLALKGQLLGPISLAAQITDEQQCPLIYDDILLAALAQHLHLRAAWQEARLSDLADATIICLDEPFLEIIGQPFLPIGWEHALNQIDEVLDGISGCKAIFAGGAVDWAMVLRSSVELIIADVYSYSHALIAAAAALRPFVERGGCVGMGLIPADADCLAVATVDGMLGRVDALLEALRPAGLAPERLLRQTVLSTNGPLSQLGVPMAERALQLLAEVSQRLRARYRLEPPDQRGAKKR